MFDIRHRVGITAPAGPVYHALATTDGLSGWWTRDVKGVSQPGEKLEFYFGYPEPAAVMEVTELIPDLRVAWRCVQGPDEWVDTTITYDLSTDEVETALLFTHADWREPIEFMHHCSTKWAYYLLGLKAGLEGRAATPYPEDMKISSWG
jgi:uncharacterized protein YndB with AHSA1/START domain